jgi:hypothetical protein
MSDLRLDDLKAEIAAERKKNQEDTIQIDSLKERIAARDGKS